MFTRRARNSAVVVDLPRCGPMLSPRAPNLVPIPGPRMERETPGQRPRPNYGHPHAQRTSEIIVLRHQLAGVRLQVDRPELTDADRSLLGAIAASLPRPNRWAPQGHDSGPLWWIHQRIPKCRLTSHDTIWAPTGSYLMVPTVKSSPHRLRNPSTGPLASTIRLVSLEQPLDATLLASPKLLTLWETMTLCEDASRANQRAVADAHCCIRTTPQRFGSRRDGRTDR